jgi:hypothetical protein
MTDNPQNLILDHLRAIRSELATVKAAQEDQTRQLIQIREDINRLRGDDLRRESVQLHMDQRLDRIETRLNLADA